MAGHGISPHRVSTFTKRALYHRVVEGCRKFEMFGTPASALPPMTDRSFLELECLLRWYVDAGVDETVDERPTDRFAVGESIPQFPLTPPAPSPSPARTPQRRPVNMPSAAGPAGLAAVESAVALARRATTLDDVRQVLLTFDGCSLSQTATNLVFGDGSPQPKVVLIGEAPGAEEDRRGVPFVGPSGRLLDKMLASIGLDRSCVFITNTIFWRPPGNRSPTSTEVAACMPFVERIIELIDPPLLVALGGPAAVALLGQAESVGRLRGRWFTYQTAQMSRPIPATATFHPAYLLRSPLQKRLAWRDLLSIKIRIDEH
jgi:DNA polymerase